MDRRTFLQLSATAAAGVLLPAPLRAMTVKERPAEWALSLQNIHTGERLDCVYRAAGGFVAESLAEVDRVLRDHRTGEVRPIDPVLLDQLHALAQNFECREPIQIISGFRSSQTNAQLRQAGHKTARKSFHLSGQAVDIRLPGVDHDDLRRAALALKAGGVGNYPGPRFVHLDTGPIRTW